MIEGGLVYPNSFFSTTREKQSIMWTASVARRVKISMPAETEKYEILRFTSRRLIFRTEATLSSGNRRRFVVLAVFSVERRLDFKKFLQLVRALFFN